MWYETLDNGEPLQLSQDNDTASYQLFGTLSERMSQDDFDDFTEQEMQQPINSCKPHFPTKAWPEKNYSWYIREFPPDYYSAGSHVAQTEEYAQMSYASPPVNWLSEIPVKRNNVQRKSSVLNSIQNLRSTRSTLQEEIEEQQILNTSILKQSAEVTEYVHKMKTQNENLRTESEIMENRNQEFEVKFDQEKKELTESIGSKRRAISEIKHDAELIQARREEKTDVTEEIKGLHKTIEDVDLDIYWLKHFYKIDYDKMVIFPFWKLEEDLERALQGEDPTLYKEEGPPERDHEAEGDGYDYEDHDFFDYEERIDEDEKSKSDFQKGTVEEEDETPESDTRQSRNRKSTIGSCKSRLGRLSNLKLGSRLNRFITNISSGFGRSAGRKIRNEKNNKSSCFVSWFRRVLRISNGNRGD